MRECVRSWVVVEHAVTVSHYHNNNTAENGRKKTQRTQKGEPWERGLATLVLECEVGTKAHPPESRVYAEAGEMLVASTRTWDNRRGQENRTRQADASPVKGLLVCGVGPTRAGWVIGRGPTDAEASRGLPRERGTPAKAATAA